MKAKGKNAAKKAQDWPAVFDHLITNGATTPATALGTAEIKTRLRIPDPDFDGMWKRGFIEYLQPDGSGPWYCYAAVAQLPADPVAAPVVRNFD
jgi:hypothetical protein